MSIIFYPFFTYKDLDDLHSEFIPQVQRRREDEDATDDSDDDYTCSSNDSVCQQQHQLSRRTERFLQQNQIESENICNAINTSVVNQDDLNLKTKLEEGCDCSKKCTQNIPFQEVRDHALRLTEMTKGEKEIYIMARLNAKTARSSDACRERTDRKRTRYEYMFQGREICRAAFLIVYDIGEFALKALIKHLQENGLSPRVHGNTNKRPSNAFSFEVVHKVVQFIQNYAEEYGLPQPASTRKETGGEILLPCAESKQSLFDKYAEMCKSSDSTAVKLTSFKNIWYSCCLHIKFMTPKTDMRPVFENCKDDVSSAVSADDKMEAINKYSDHLKETREEREVFSLR